MFERRPIDILKCSFEPRLWHKVPYLVCGLEVQNASTGIYFLPLTAKLEMFDELVAFCVPIFMSPGSHSSGNWNTTWGGGVMRQANLHWDQGTIRHLYCCFEMRPMVLHSLATAFETKHTTSYRLELEIGALQELAAMVNIEPNGATGSRTMLLPSDGILTYAEGQVKTHDWQDWMKSWGAAIEVIYLPKELAGNLREIKPKMGVGADWEVIGELLRNHQGGKSETVLLSNEQDLEKRMREIISGADKELLIMCRAFDETLLTPIIEAQDRGTVVKIMTVPIERLKEEKYRETARLTQAGRKASSKVQLKTNLSQHARIIVSGHAALVGSADPDYYGLKIHRNASVYTTNPLVIQAAKLFFNSLWEESEA